MSTTAEQSPNIEPWLWRPHPLALVGTVAAVALAVSATGLLTLADEAVVAFFREHQVGGMVGSAKPEDQLLGLGIVAGFGWMMTVVGTVVLLKARARRRAVMRALGGASGVVVWVHQEIADVDGAQEHVIAFGLRSGKKVRATVPPQQVDDVWSWVKGRCGGASVGHDTTQERRFAVNPALMLTKPRVVDGVQRLTGRARAR